MPHEGYNLGVNAQFNQVKEATQAVGTLYKQLEKVNRSSEKLHIPTNLPREINHVSTVTASYIERLESEGKTYQANQQKVKAYSSAISSLQARQKELERTLSETSSSLDKNSAKYRATEVLINKNATEINKFKSSIKLAQAEMDRLHPTGFDRWVKGAKKVNSATDTMKNKLHSAWDSIKGGATVATAGIAAVGAAAYSGAKQAGTIQQRYREINNLAVLGGEKQKEVTKQVTEMQRQGRDMSIKYGKSQQEIAEGYEDLVKRGYTTKQAVGALQTELQASVASGDKFSDVTTVSSQVLDAFGMRADNTSKMLKNTKLVVNELAYSADATSTGFSDLGIAMSYVGTAAKANNISLAETASALGVLSNNGLESDKAGTALRSTINGLTNQINKIGSKNSVFTKLGITKSEMLDAHGNLKSLSEDMGILYKHIQEHSKGGSQQNGFFKSIFGTTGMNGAEILAKGSKEVEELTKRTEKAGKTGTYVAKLAAKNMGTAQGSAASAKQAMNAFKMTLGNAVLPAISKASNELAKFLLSKDGKKFQRDVGGAVSKVANAFVKFIEWSATHKKEIEWIGGGILAGYSVVKAAKFIAFLGDIKKGLEAIKAVKFVGGLFGKGGMAKEAAQGVENVGGALPKTATRGGAGFLTGSLQSIKSAGGFKGLAPAGKVTTGLAGAGVALDAGTQFFNAFKDRHNADKRSVDIGKGIGSGIGGGIGLFFGGPAGAAIGSQIGKVVGGWGGQAVNKFTKGWQSNKPPKNFWSLENLGWSTKDMFGKIGKGWNNFWGGMGNWRKQQASGWSKWTKQTGAGIDRWATDVGKSWNKGVKGVKNWGSNVGKSWNKGVKGVGKWIHDIPSNLGKTGKSIGHWASQTGNNIHKGWNKGITASHNFFKNLPKNTKKTERDVKKWASNTGKNIQGAWNKGKKATVNFVKSVPGRLSKAKKGVDNWASKTGKSIQGAWTKGNKAAVKFVKGIPGHLSKAKKGVDNWGSKTGQSIQKTWNKGVKGATNFAQKIPGQINKSKKGIDSWASKTGKSIQSAWNTGKKGLTSFISSIPGQLEKAYKGIASWASKTGQAIQKGWNGFWGKAGDIRKGVTNNVKAFGNDLAFATGGSKHTFKYEKISSHAAGGHITSSHTALVGEAGPELAYKHGAKARLLGANGPAITKVHSGEHILNAHDTAKVMSGGLGQGKVLNGYASGTTRLGKTTKSVASDYKKISQNATKSLTKVTKTNRNNWDKISKTTTKSLGKLTKTNRRSWNNIETNAGKSVKRLAKTNQSTWTKITRQTNKQTDKTRKDAISDYTNMRKGVHKQMDNLHDGVIDLASTTSKGFGKELGHMKGYAHDAMGDTIDQVNKGITGIDKVLGQFGGNTSVIKPVKFATGTDSNGRLTQNTLAMVNDAKSGPRQEALVSDTNEIYYPRGNDVTMMIPKGWGVLNGTQTQQVSKSAGLRHFAKGSGVSHSQLRKIAEKAGADPSKAFAQMYSNNLHASGTDLKKGSINLAQNSSTHFGNPWSNAMWTVINNAIGGGSGHGGTREKFLKYAEETFSGVRYVMGAASKTASDCSGMVSQALAHFGLNAGRSTVDMQHSSSLEYLGKSLNRTIPGDLVIFGHGTGAAGHVGIIKNPKTGTMFNETPPRARVTRIADDMGMGYGFYRVKGLHDAKSSKKTVTANKQLQALAKRELGPSALKWIKDKLGDEGSLGGNIGGEGVQRWAGTVKRILGMLHLSTSKAMVDRVLRQINTESSGNPHARQPGADPDGDGSGPALGLMQTKRSTFETYKRKGDNGGIFNGPSNIYAGLNYAKHRYGNSLSFLGNGHGYAKGGKPAIHTPFIAGEQGPELITADGPVKVDSHEETKRKMSNLSNLIKLPKSAPPKSTGKPPITININLNGPIGTSRRDAIDFANEVKQIVAEQILNLFGDEFGGDPSIY